MSKLTDAFRNIHIINAYDYAQRQPFITYQAYQQWSRTNGWNVSWFEEGRIRNQNFSTLGKTRAETLELAKAWATFKFGIESWAQTPYRSWMDAEFVKARTKALKQALADVEGVTA
jgi:hypothetical protein